MSKKHSHPLRKLSTAQLCAYCGQLFYPRYWIEKCCSLRCTEKLKHDEWESQQLEQILSNGRDLFDDPPHIEFDAARA